MNNETSHENEKDSSKVVQQVESLKSRENTSIQSNVDKTPSISSDSNNHLSKDKKYNGFLRNTNRKHKESDKEKIPTPIVKNTNPNQISKPKFNPKFKHQHKNKQQDVDKDNIDTNIGNSVKEDLFSPEHLLFSHLRQKTGSNPIQFWENLYILLKEKDFKDIKRSDMSLISYAALYESTDIFETLLYDYGHLIEKEEIEKSIFKISANKNPLILQHTISFYNKNHKPTEEFINDFINVVGKFSYREEANQLIVNWLSKVMTDSNKNSFWNTCFQNKNIPLMSVALQNYELNQYLKNNKETFDEHINNSCKKFTILSLITKKVKQDIINPLEDSISTTNNFITPEVSFKEKEQNKKEEEEILNSLRKQLPTTKKTTEKPSDVFIKSSTKKIIKEIRDTAKEDFAFIDTKKKLETPAPEIIIKKKRKVV